jgi:hypothetical protein
MEIVGLNEGREAIRTVQKGEITMNRYAISVSRVGTFVEMHLIFASCALDAINKVEAKFDTRLSKLGAWTGYCFESRLIASAWPRQQSS